LSQASSLSKFTREPNSILRRKRLKHAQPQANYLSYAAVWALRLLLTVRDGKRVQRYLCDQEEFFETVGIPPMEPSCGPDSLRAILGERLPVLEESLPPDMEVLSENIQLLGDALDLTNIECEILAFAVILYTVSWLENSADTLGVLDTQRAYNALATALLLEESDVRRALAPDATLAAAGMLRVRADMGDLKTKLQLLRSLPDVLLTKQDSTKVMLQPFFHTSPLATLTRDDFPHATAEWSLVARYLESTIHDHKSGINVLIYGPPGTGKTAWVGALAKELHLELCEVATQDTEGQPLKGQERFGAFLLAQRALRRMRRHVLLFDEVEDALPQLSVEVFGVRMRGPGSISKASMNQVLEQNYVPCIWVCNSIEQFDPAFLRRYDLIFEMPPPTRRIRKMMFRRFLEDIPVSDGWLDHMADNRDLMPGVIERASNVVRNIRPNTPKESETILNQVLKGTLEAMGYTAGPAKTTANSLPYSLDYVNADVDLIGVRDGLRMRGCGSLCLYGASGTGKSEYGRYLAQELDRPLIIKKCSDLLSMYVGGSERNIANAFKQATEEDAILLLDEADSLLRDRLLSDHSWEITLVNELLTQMEGYPGIFIATSNLMDNIELAALRRFTMKIKFNYLKPQQSMALLGQICTEKGEFSEALKRRIQMLEFGPGDVAAAVAQAALCREPLSVDALVTILERECALKNRGARPFLGFTGAVLSV